MARGITELKAPHICGQLIHVRVDWWNYSGSLDEAPDYEENYTYYIQDGDDKDIERCPKCGVELDWVAIFISTVQALSLQAEYDELDKQDDDREPSWAADWERDPDDLLPPGKR